MEISSLFPITLCRLSLKQNEFEPSLAAYVDRPPLGRTFTIRGVVAMPFAKPGSLWLLRILGNVEDVCSAPQQVHCKLTDLILKVILFGAERLHRCGGCLFRRSGATRPRERNRNSGTAANKLCHKGCVREIPDVEKEEREHPSDDRR